METYRKDYSEYRFKLNTYMIQEIERLYEPANKHLQSILSKFFRDTDYTIIIHENGNKYSMTPVGVPKFKPYYMTSEDKEFNWFQQEYIELSQLILKEKLQLQKVIKLILNTVENNMHAYCYVNYVFPMQQNKDLTKHLSEEFLKELEPYKEIVTERTLANMLLA